MPKRCETHYHAPLGLTDIGSAIKELVVCYAVWLGSVKWMGLRTCAKCVGLVPCFGGEELHWPLTGTTHNNNTQLGPGQFGGVKGFFVFSQ